MMTTTGPATVETSGQRDGEAPKLSGVGVSIPESVNTFLPKPSSRSGQAKVDGPDFYENTAKDSSS